MKSHTKCYENESRGSSLLASSSDDDDFSEDIENEDVRIEDGILTEQFISSKICNLGKVADGTQYAFLNIDASGCLLVDITALAQYEHLQKIDLSNNKLIDLKPLGNLVNLIELNVCRNLIENLLDFAPPYNLKIANFSHNKILSLPDISQHHYLQELDLSYNEIGEIFGLQGCRRLSHLNMAHNRIAKIDGISGLPIKHLNLEYNMLESITNLGDSPCLREIDLSGNFITSLSGLEDHWILETIKLASNQVIDIWELKWLERLPMLRRLNLEKNPVTDIPDYRHSVLFYLQRLTNLDGLDVSVAEKVESSNMFKATKSQIAARDHMMHVVYNFINPAYLKVSTLPSSKTPYPMIALVGPEGSSKDELAMKISEEFSDFFGYGSLHTTRKPLPNEENGKTVFSLLEDDFRNEIKRGQFILTYTNMGNWFGLTHDSIENIARQGLASVVQLELDGALSLKKTTFEPRYILILPESEKYLQNKLQSVGGGIYSDEDIGNCLESLSDYVQYNIDNPGFFDFIIRTDSEAEAYDSLRRIVLGFLGIGSETEASSGNGAATEGGSVGAAGELGKAVSTVLSEGGAPIHLKSGMSRVVNTINPRHELHESSSTAAGGGSKALTTLSGLRTNSRGLIEGASLLRRQEAAKEALTNVSQQKVLFETTWNRLPQELFGESIGGTAVPDLRSCSAPAATLGINQNNSNYFSSEIPPPDSGDSSVGRQSPASSTLASSAPSRGSDEEVGGGDDHDGDTFQSPTGSDRIEFILEGVETDRDVAEVGNLHWKDDVVLQNSAAAAAARQGSAAKQVDSPETPKDLRAAAVAIGNNNGSRGGERRDVDVDGGGSESVEPTSVAASLTLSLNETETPASSLMATASPQTKRPKLNRVGSDHHKVLPPIY